MQRYLKERVFAGPHLLPKVFVKYPEKRREMVIHQRAQGKGEGTGKAKRSIVF